MPDESHKSGTLFWISLPSLIFEVPAYLSVSLSKLCILVLILAHGAMYTIALRIFIDAYSFSFLLLYNKPPQHSVAQCNNNIFDNDLTIWQNSVGEAHFCSMRHQPEQLDEIRIHFQVVHLHGLAVNLVGALGWVPQFCYVWACLFSCLQFLITGWLGTKREEMEAVGLLKNYT